MPLVMANGHGLGQTEFFFEKRRRCGVWFGFIANLENAKSLGIERRRG